jgi:hypothetical protein
MTEGIVSQAPEVMRVHSSAHGFFFLSAKLSAAKVKCIYSFFH